MYPHHNTLGRCRMSDGNCFGYPHAGGASVKAGNCWSLVRDHGVMQARMRVRQ